MTPQERSQFWADMALSARHNAIVRREMAKQWPAYAKADLAAATEMYLNGRLYLRHARAFKNMEDRHERHAA